MMGGFVSKLEVINLDKGLTSRRSGCNFTRNKLAE